MWMRRVGAREVGHLARSRLDSERCEDEHMAKLPPGPRGPALYQGLRYTLEPLGYRLTIAALLLFFLGVLERRKPLVVAAVSIGFSTLSFYLIGDLLRVPLPVGPWGW